MKLCDINTHIGHWPFRKLPCITVGALLKEMDRLGVERAALCHNHSVFYRNSHRANEELFAQTKAHRDRLCPVGTLNPCYIKWPEDLDICVNEFGFKAIRMLPAYHNYCLDSPDAAQMASKLAAMKLAALIPFRIVDKRQAHWFDTRVNVSPNVVLDLAEKIPQLKIITTQVVGALFPDLLKRLKKQAAANVCFDISRIHTILPRELPQLIKQLGKQRFFYGSAMPFRTAESAILRLALLKNSSDRSFIGEKNFNSIFGVS